MERTKDIVLEGHVNKENLKAYDNLVSQCDVLSIDISNLICDIDNDDFASDFYIDETTPLLIEKLISNRCFSQNFIICGNLVLSSDKSVIIHSFDNKSIDIPTNVKIIGNFAFCNNLARTMDIPYGVKHIGEAAFNSCRNLKELILPDSIETLGVTAFGLCSIESVQLSRNLKSIPECCFEYNNIDEIDIPSSVKSIESDAFHCNSFVHIELPEGIESIGSNVFSFYDGYIYFPSTIRHIEKDFFYEEMIDYPKDCLPYIEVSQKNPIFFSKDGTLYKRTYPETPYLGYIYQKEKEPDQPLFFFPDENDSSQEYSYQEIMAKYKYCKPINDENTLFWVYEAKLWNTNESGYNIIDRKLHHYINETIVRSIDFCKNKFILINDNVIYSLDMKHCLLEKFDGYSFGSCDNDGRIYVTKDIPVPKERIRIHNFSETTPRAGCIDINKNIIIPCEYDGYKHLTHFDEHGLAIVNKGSKYGMIDTKGNIVIPIDYHYIYTNFDHNGLSMVAKKNKGEMKMMFINMQNEIVGTFLEPDIQIHIEQCFHLYEYNGKLGYAKWHGYNYSEPIYKDIRIIDNNTIEVSIDGISYETIIY